MHDFVSRKIELFQIGNNYCHIGNNSVEKSLFLSNHNRNDEKSIQKSIINREEEEKLQSSPLYTKQGRIIRAREDIDEGEILVIEKAYASVLHQSNIHFNSHSFCVVCQKKKKIIQTHESSKNCDKCCNGVTCPSNSLTPSCNCCTNTNDEWMLCGDEGCEFLRNNVYRENELMDGQTMYNYLLRMAEECGIEFSLLLLVYRICRKFEFDCNSNNEIKSREYYDRNKMDNLISLETHRDEIYPEHLFLFKKASSCLKERIFLEEKVISEDLIIDTFCRIFVNAHSITHTRWWWHQYAALAAEEESNFNNKKTIENELDEISQFFNDKSLNNNVESLDSPFFIPSCSSDREDHTENSCADFRDIGTGLFPIVSMFDHSCSPNCSFQTFDDMKSKNSYSGNIILVQTVKKIKKGEELCISYIDIMNPTCIRRRELWYSKYFVCRCSRCMSETEENRMVRAYSCVVGNSQCNNNGYLVPIYHCNVSEEPKADLRHVHLMNESILGSEPFDSENDFNIEDFDEEEYDKALSMFEDIYENDESREFNHDQREIDEDYIKRISHWKCTLCGNTIRGDGQESECFQNMERHLNQELISIGQQVSEDNIKVNDLPRDEYCQVLLGIVHTLWQYIQQLESGYYPGYESLRIHPNHYLLFQLKGKFISMLIKLFERGWWSDDVGGEGIERNCDNAASNNFEEPFVLVDNDGLTISEQTKSVERRRNTPQQAREYLNLGLEYLSEMANSTKQIFPTFHTEIMLFYCKLLKYKKWMRENNLLDSKDETISDNEEQLLFNLLSQYRVIIK